MEQMKQFLDTHDLMTIIGDKESSLILLKSQIACALKTVELQKIKIADLEATAKKETNE